MQPASCGKKWGIRITSIFIKVLEILKKHIFQCKYVFVLKQFLIIIIGP